MEWQLEQFMAERVERGKKLLSESEEHRGSTDLQVCAGRGGAAVAAAAGCQTALAGARPLTPTTAPHYACRCLLTRWT